MQRNIKLIASLCKKYEHVEYYNLTKGKIVKRKKIIIEKMNATIALIINCRSGYTLRKEEDLNLGISQNSGKYLVLKGKNGIMFIFLLTALCFFSNCFKAVIVKTFFF